MMTMRLATCSGRCPVGNRGSHRGIIKEGQYPVKRKKENPAVLKPLPPLMAGPAKASQGGPAVLALMAVPPELTQGLCPSGRFPSSWLGHLL